MREERLINNPLTSATGHLDPSMGHLGERQDPEKREKRWRKVNVWSIKGPILVLALLLGFFADALHWGTAPLAAGAAITIPVIGYRDFWNKGRFWITVFVLAMFQVPLVIAVRPLIEKLKFPFMLMFGLFDCVLVALAISWVCSENSEKHT